MEFQSRAQWKEVLEFYKQVNKAIYERLKSLAADAIFDGARVLRVPGTVHNRNGQKCLYTACLNEEGEEPLTTYTLGELGEYLGVSPAQIEDRSVGLNPKAPILCAPMAHAR